LTQHYTDAQFKEVMGLTSAVIEATRDAMEAPSLGEIRVVGKAHGAINALAAFDDPVGELGEHMWAFKQFISHEQLLAFAAMHRLRLVEGADD
jgi:hypothetical protein